MGRSKEFDRQNALRSAIRVFWSKGFDGTSLCDLLSAMEISRSSFYETFKSKEDLFREALASYNSENSQSVLSEVALEQSLRNGPPTEGKSSRTRLQQFFKEQIDFALDPDLPGGCFLTNTTATMTTACEQVKDTLIKRARSREQELLHFLEAAKESGELAPDQDAEGLARLLLCFNYGIMVMSRLEPHAKFYDSAIDALSGIFEKNLIDD